MPYYQGVAIRILDKSQVLKQPQASSNSQPRQSTLHYYPCCLTWCSTTALEERHKEVSAHADFLGWLEKYYPSCSTSWSRDPARLTP